MIGSIPVAKPSMQTTNRRIPEIFTFQLGRIFSFSLRLCLEAKIYNLTGYGAALNPVCSPHLNNPFRILRENLGPHFFVFYKIPDISDLPGAGALTSLTFDIGAVGSE